MFECGIYFQLKEKNTCGAIFCAKTCAQYYSLMHEYLFE
jgi:hypothetical protein